MEDDNSIRPTKTSHTSKVVIATIIIFAIIATAGFAVGIYGVVASLGQSNDIANLKRDINNLTERLGSNDSTKQQAEYPTVIVNGSTSGATSDDAAGDNSSTTNTNAQTANDTKPTNTVEIKEDSAPGSTIFPRAFILSDGSYAILNANYEIIVQSTERDIVTFTSCDSPKCSVRTTDGGSRGYVYDKSTGELTAGRTTY